MTLLEDFRTTINITPAVCVVTDMNLREMSRTRPVDDNERAKYLDTDILSCGFLMFGSRSTP